MRQNIARAERICEDNKFKSMSEIQVIILASVFKEVITKERSLELILPK